MTIRPDRRTEPTQLRPFSSSQNLLNRCDGSAQFQFDKTAVLVSITGPTEVKFRDEKLDRASLEVIVRPLTGLSSTKERVLESVMRSTFANVILTGLHPRTSIQIVAQVMKDDGCVSVGVIAVCLLVVCGVRYDKLDNSSAKSLTSIAYFGLHQVQSAAINATTMALLDAGIPMNALVGSVTCMVGKEDGEILMDPTMEELSRARSIHTFAFDSASRTSVMMDENGGKGTSGGVVLYSESTGDFTEDEYFGCMSLCQQATHKVHGFVRTAVEKKIEREYQQITGS
ncbi:ribosomal protein S5 domain 2-type protein [Jimgerdemannia flammicorona]|uniref:Ribosomal protein S5 domain 2-type protein n=1 Tax=Jimgerdemannia flammicorona TaxID=994334 RepID=A0A433DH49_9FUNG|nr:ribosomal protein S5 domain 2-type protein [Jimgerdemannia flammicorona]